MGALLRRCGSSHAPPALYTHLASPSLPFALSATLSRCPPVRPLSNGRASTFARAAAGHVALESPPCRNGRECGARGSGFTASACGGRARRAHGAAAADDDAAEMRTHDPRDDDAPEFEPRELAAERTGMETAALAALGVTDFASLGVDAVLCQNLKRRGFTEPTYVQVTPHRGY
jgi:hypothetical protein